MTNYARLAHSCSQSFNETGVDDTHPNVGWDLGVCPHPTTAGQSSSGKPLYIFILYNDENSCYICTGPTTLRFIPLFALSSNYQTLTTYDHPDNNPAERYWQTFCNFTKNDQSCPANWVVYVVPGRTPFDLVDKDCNNGGTGDCGGYDEFRDCNNNCVPDSFALDNLCHDGSEIAQNYAYSEHQGQYNYANLKCCRHYCSWGNCEPNECCGVWTEDYLQELREGMCDNAIWDGGLDAKWNQGCPENEDGTPLCDNLNDIKFIWGDIGDSDGCQGREKAVDQIFEDIVVNHLGGTLPLVAEEDPPWKEQQIRIFHIPHCSGSEGIPDWDSDSNFAKDLRDEFIWNDVDGIYDETEATTAYWGTWFEAGVMNLLSCMVETMPSLVGNGRRSIPKSMATNHILLIPAEGGCIDSGITSGEYFGSLTDTQDLIDDFEREYPGGKLHIQVIQNCGMLGNAVSSECQDLACGCVYETGTWNTSYDGTEARDNKLPSSAPSEVKVVLCGHYRSDLEEWHFNCRCDNETTDMTSDCPSSSMLDLGEAWRFANETTESDISGAWLVCSMAILDDWIDANFSSGMPDQSTLVHVLGGGKCLDGVIGAGRNTETGARWTYIAAMHMAPYLGNAFLGHGQYITYDAVNYPSANWIDMMNLGLRNILGRGVCA